MKEQNTVEQEISIRYKNHAQLMEFLGELKNIPNLIEFHIS
jgi:hypothetical protein